MATYLILNLIVLAVVLAVYVLYPGKPRWQVIISTLVLLLVLTAVFDSLIIAMDIVRYTDGKYLGIFVGMAPVEDFAYTIAACLLAPVVWDMVGQRRQDD